MKECTRCGIQKSFDDFHRHKTTADGFQTICKVCTREYRQKYYVSNKDRERRDNERWKQLNPLHKEWHTSDVAKSLQRKRRDKARAKVIEYFGNVCVKCGSDKELELDHVNGDGKQHRRELFGDRTGSDIYRYLASHDMDTGGYDMQLLCSYCHKKKTATEMKAKRGRG